MDILFSDELIYKEMEEALPGLKDYKYSIDIP